MAKTSKALPVYVLNGPNLNLLGMREVDIYGRTSLAQIEKRTVAAGKKHGLSVVFRQSNAEGDLIDWIQEARTAACGVILNAAGYTHTSVAILDALRALDKPIIEVHLSNPQAREEFRRDSFVALAATGIIAGFGADGYELAIEAMSKLVEGTKK